MSSSDTIVFRRDTGFQEHLNYRVEVHEDRAEALLDITGNLLNRRGVLHGGVYATLIDAACGYACSRHLSDDASQPVVTVSLTVNYLATPDSNAVRAVGRVTGGGRKTLFTEAEMTDGTGKRLATATGVFKRVATQQPREEKP